MAAALAILATLLAVAATSAVVRTRSAGITHPDEWDPRIEDIADFVAEQRGLSWQHPVFVDFLDEAAFTDEVTADGADLSDDERAELERSAGVFRALGLMEGEVDLLAEQNQLRGQGVLAFYDPATERVTVRGTEMSPATRVTLAHELTHALQDQWFDLERYYGDQVDATDTQQSIYRFLTEGDAVGIQEAYAGQLSAADAQTYQDERGRLVDEADYSGVPAVLTAYFSAPYSIGPPFVGVLRAEGDDAAVDEALRDPPPSEAQLLDPRQFRDDRPVADVVAPDVPDGAEETDRGDLGALLWYLTLAERLDPQRALQVTDGWGGDQYVEYDMDGRTCIAARLQGATAEDTTAASDALTDWLAAGPAAADAEVRRDGDAVLLRSCDPGADAELGVEGNATDALALPTNRLYIVAGLLQQGVSFDVATCVAGEVLPTFTLAELTGAAELDQAEVQQRVLAAAATCPR